MHRSVLSCHDILIDLTENTATAIVLRPSLLDSPGYCSADRWYVSVAQSQHYVPTNVPRTVLRWMFNNIENLCDPHNTQRFTCAGSKVVYNASIIWGTIGPQRMFQQGQVYSGLMYFFILGVSCPLHSI